MLRLFLALNACADSFLTPPQAHAGELVRRCGQTDFLLPFADSFPLLSQVRVLKDGGHDVPEGMYQWGTSIKKATHSR